jgi:HPt (histidine-containing phosphotransfer) domain-containing protein
VTMDTAYHQESFAAVAWDEETRPATSAAAAVFDLTHLRRYTAGCADIEREIIGLFAAELPGRLLDLVNAKTPKDWHMAAHTLKGSALAVGANRLAQLCAAAEKAHPHERAATCAGLASSIDALKAELALLDLA